MFVDQCYGGRVNNRLNQPLHNKMHSQGRSGDSGLWRPGWGTKAIGIAVGGLFALFSIGSPDGYSRWGSVLMAAAAVVVPILQFRKFWSLSRFWITASLLAVTQVPLVAAVQPLVERLMAVSLLSFGIVVGLFVIVLILLVCSKSSGASS